MHSYQISCILQIESNVRTYYDFLVHRTVLKEILTLAVVSNLQHFELGQSRSMGKKRAIYVTFLGGPATGSPKLSISSL